MAFPEPPDLAVQARYALLYQAVSQIPPGRAATYGLLGRALKRPLIAREVGGAMRHARDPIPWHRVVGSGAVIVVHKRHPSLAEEQRLRLQNEGFPFRGDKLDPRGLLSLEELIELVDRY